MLGLVIKVIHTGASELDEPNDDILMGVPSIRILIQHDMIIIGYGRALNLNVDSA